MGRYSIRYQDHELVLPRGIFIIGRSPDCDFRLSGAHVSRRHARLRVEEEVLIEDLGSRNGVLVNGERIRTARCLVHGDVIRIGLDALSFVDEASVSPDRTLLTDRPPPPSFGCPDANDANAVTVQVQLETLSKREREVFELMAMGFTHREIAAKLFVSVKTVETHRTRIGEKLGCRNLREIMHRAFVGGALRGRGGT